MKRAAIALLSASLILSAGCSRELPDSYSSQDRVFFHVNDLSAVKGGTQLSSATISDFVVAASWTDTSGVSTPFMSGAKATRSGSVWTTDPTFYYPASGELSFYAYAPYAASSAGVTNFGPDSGGLYSLDYAPPTEVADQEDLCLAEPVTGITRTGTAVAMSFHHATTQVVFKARTADTLSATRKMYIDTIKVKGVVASKHLTYQDASPYFIFSDHSPVTTEDYEITADDGGLASDPLSADVSAVSTDAGRMYLLPQTITSSGITVTVSWRLMDTSGGTPAEISRGTESLNLDAVTAEWKPSRRYTYVLNVKPGSCRFYTNYAYFDQEEDDNSFSGYTHHNYFDEENDDNSFPGTTYGNYFDEEDDDTVSGYTYGMYFGEEVF